MLPLLPVQPPYRLHPSRLPVDAEQRCIPLLHPVLDRPAASLRTDAQDGQRDVVLLLHHVPPVGRVTEHGGAVPLARHAHCHVGRRRPLRRSEVVNLDLQTVARPSRPVQHGGDAQPPGSRIQTEIHRVVSVDDDEPQLGVLEVVAVRRGHRHDLRPDLRVDLHLRVVRRRADDGVVVVLVRDADDDACRRRQRRGARIHGDHPDVMLRDRLPVQTPCHPHDPVLCPDPEPLPPGGQREAHRRVATLVAVRDLHPHDLRADGAVLGDGAAQGGEEARGAVVDVPHNDDHLRGQTWGRMKMWTVDTSVITRGHKSEHRSIA